MASRPSVRMSGNPMSADPDAGRRGSRRGRTAANQAAHAIVDDAHELEPGEIGERPDAATALSGLAPLADRDADGEAAAVAGGDDAVTALHARHTLQKRETKLRG